MLARITEKDEKYREEFAAFLQMRGFALVNPEALIFDVDEHACGMYHALDACASADTPLSWGEENAEVVEWLTNYKGTFDFYLSLKAQLEKKGELSPNQVATIHRAIDRDKVRAVEQAKPKAYTIAPGTVIVVNQFAAEDLAAMAGRARNRKHHTFLVTQVHAETEKAYRLTLRFSAQRTSHCGVCGLTLKNPESVARGIGPICAEKYGIDYSGDCLKELSDKLSSEVEVTSWIPKRSIKERIDP
jgi:hypothetical protein